MDVKHLPVTGKCKFGANCLRKTCKYAHATPKKSLGGHAEVNHRVVLRGMVKQSKELSLRRLSVLKQKSEFDQKYVLVATGLDVKSSSASPFDDAIKLIDMELKTMKSMARNVFGLKPIKWDFFQSQSVATNTAGVVNNNAAIDPSTLSEFTALSGLFDEYRCIGGYWDGFWFGDMLQGTGSAFPIAVLAYDATDNGAVTSVPNAMENAEHRLYACPVVKTSTAVAAVTQVTTETIQKIERFTYKVPSGSLLAPALSTVNAGDWQPMVPSTTYLAYGWVKLYGGIFRQIAASTVTPVAFFETVIHAEIRIRD